jgi:CheY-like chemotaxis protein
MTAALSHSPWRVLIVEDDPQMLTDVTEFLQGLTFDGRGVELDGEGDFSAAIELVRLKKVDVIILDVYRGTSAPAGEPDGLDVLAAVRDSGFVSVVLYTAHPEKVKGSTSAFVRLVGKDVNSLVKVQKELDELFSLGIPQIYRALVNHVDHTLRDYMWTFVEGSSTNLAPLAGTPCANVA